MIFIYIGIPWLLCGVVAYVMLSRGFRAMGADMWRNWDRLFMLTVSLAGPLVLIGALIVFPPFPPFLGVLRAWLDKPARW